jgi:PleD family two-component response regulator
MSDEEKEIIKKVIMVDDVQFHLLSARERLKKHFDIYPAQSSEILFELLQEVMPDIILLDIKMPEVDGFQIIEQLKADVRYKNIPVIFLSSKYDKETLLKGMKLGAVDFVTKPFDDTELIQRIEYQLHMSERDDDVPIILAVDDNPSILKAINEILCTKYRVYTLPEPQRVKDFVKMVTPDLFLLDCQMPGISGFELVNIIRSIPGHDDTPIVFLTSEGTVDFISVALHLGIAGFLIKPIDAQVLHEKIAALLENFVIYRRIREIRISEQKGGAI